MGRAYLRIRTKRGQWYVSYYGASTKTGQDIMRDLRAAVIGGPFPTKVAALAWLDSNPANDKSKSVIWQER